MSKVRNYKVVPSDRKVSKVKDTSVRKGALVMLRVRQNQCHIEDGILSLSLDYSDALQREEVRELAKNITQWLCRNDVSYCSDPSVSWN